MGQDSDPRAVALAALCVYEAAAIISGRIPTITSMVWKVRHKNSAKLVTWLIGGYLMWHLLLEEAKDQEG